VDLRPWRRDPGSLTSAFPKSHGRPVPIGPVSDVQHASVRVPSSAQADRSSTFAENVEPQIQARMQDGSRTARPNVNDRVPPSDGLPLRPRPCPRAMWCRLSHGSSPLRDVTPQPPAPNILGASRRPCFRGGSPPGCFVGNGSPSKTRLFHGPPALHASSPPNEGDASDSFRRRCGGTRME